MTSVEDIIQGLRDFEPSEGYYVAFSGGKDSVVILDIVKRSGVKYDAHFNHTSVDPPELIAFIKEHYPDVERHRPEKTMFQLILSKQLPLRQHRWCCNILKERGGSGRIVITGIRKAESIRRSKRNRDEISFSDKTKTFCHIIFDWEDKDVWEYIKTNSLPYCCLYDEGWHRIGCIGCPNGNKQTHKREFDRYPNVKKAYISAIAKLKERKPDYNKNLSPEQIFDWWISGLSIKRYKGMLEQTELQFDTEYQAIKEATNE